MIERHDIEQLADMACRLDDLKNLFPESARRTLAQAVEEIHQVAGQIDAQCRFGLYAGASA